MSHVEGPISSDTRATLDFVSSLWAMHHALEAASERMEGRIGLTAPQRLVVRMLGRYPGMTSGQLAQSLGVHPGTVSTQLGRLERRKLVTRLRDPRDRRRVMLGLTASGRAFDRPMEGTVEQAIATVMASLSPADLAASERVLDRIRTALADVGNVPAERSRQQRRPGGAPARKTGRHRAKVKERAS